MRDKSVLTGILLTIFGGVLGWLGTTYMYQSQLKNSLPGTPAYGIGGGPDTNSAEITQTVESVLRTWEPQSQKAARAIITTYGPPVEITPTLMVWLNNGPWKRTVAYNDMTIHNFPFPHIETIEQTVPYRIPAERISDLGEFNGSITANRTLGELTVRGPNEAMNYTVLNIAHDLIAKRISVQEARKQLSTVAEQLQNGQTPSLATGLRFAISVTESHDPDVAQ